MSAVARLVLVGAGAMGREWIGAIDRSADAELVGVVDLDRDVAEDALKGRGDAAGVVVGDDVARVALESEGDAVVNVTVPAAHLPVNLASLDAGYAVLCEKPITPTVRDALILVAAAEVSGRLLMVSQSRRYYAALSELRTRSAGLGEIGLVSTQFMKAPHFGGFREQMEHPLLVDMAIHAFDVARYLLDATPRRVDCRTFNPSWSWFHGDAAAVATFEFDDGTRYLYHGSWVAPGLETSRNGSWRVGAAGGTGMWDGQSTVTAQRGNGESEQIVVRPGHAESIDGSLAEFISALSTGATPTGEVHDNVMTLAMVESAVQSADNGLTVEIAELVDQAQRKALATDLRPDLRAAIEGWGHASAHLAGVSSAARR